VRGAICQSIEQKEATRQQKLGIGVSILANRDFPGFARFVGYIVEAATISLLREA
jgi:hypothetical protein